MQKTLNILTLLFPITLLGYCILQGYLFFSHVQVQWLPIIFQKTPWYLFLGKCFIFYSFAYLCIMSIGVIYKQFKYNVLSKQISLLVLLCVFITCMFSNIGLIILSILCLFNVIPSMFMDVLKQFEMDTDPEVDSMLEMSDEEYAEVCAETEQQIEMDKLRKAQEQLQQSTYVYRDPNEGYYQNREKQRILEQQKEFERKQREAEEAAYLQKRKMEEAERERKSKTIRMITQMNYNTLRIEYESGNCRTFNGELVTYSPSSFTLNRDGYQYTYDSTCSLKYKRKL